MILGSNRTAYTGVVATRCFMPWLFGSTNKQVMSESWHYATEDLTAVQLLIPNWYIDTNNNGNTWAEIGTGASATVTASVVDTGSVARQVLFSGIASGTVPDGSDLLSDVCSATISKGWFQVRIFWNCTAGIIYTNNANATIGDRFDAGVSGITDRTMTGSVPNNGAGFSVPPIAILASTTRASALLIGTSQTAGVVDANSASGDKGVIARSIGPGYGYINAGVPADSAARVVAAHTRRVSLAQYVSDVIVEHGSNDDVSGDLAGVEANMATIWGYFPTKRVWSPTAIPYTSGAWTLADQSDQAIIKNFGPFNSFILAKPAPLFGAFDIGAVVGTSNKWRAPGYTADGQHGNQFACLAIKYSGAVAI